MDEITVFFVDGTHVTHKVSSSRYWSYKGSFFEVVEEKIHTLYPAHRLREVRICLSA